MNFSTLLENWKHTGIQPDDLSLQSCIAKIKDKINSHPEMMLDVLFADALMQTAQSDHHIYLRQYEIPQIVLFDLLIHKLPFVALAHEIINTQALHDSVAFSEIVWIDVGIGRGIQTEKWLAKMAKAHPRLKKLTIIGIEPFRDALETATEKINTLAASLPFTVQYYPIEAFIENLKAEDIQSLFPENYDVVMLNSTLTLHHIAQQEQRQQFFNLAKSLGVLYIYLTEPDSDHYHEDLLIRIQNAYRHFGAVFQVIDQLSISQRDKNGLKLFFGREIQDIARTDTHERFEKHEPYDRWLHYLKQSGYQTQKIHLTSQSTLVNLQENIAAEGFVSGISHQDVNVLSLISAILS